MGTAHVLGHVHGVHAPRHRGRGLTDPGSCAALDPAAFGRLDAGGSSVLKGTGLRQLRRFNDCR